MKKFSIIKLFSEKRTYSLIRRKSSLVRVTPCMGVGLGSSPGVSANINSAVEELVPRLVWDQEIDAGSSPVCATNKKDKINRNYDNFIPTTATTKN